MIRSAGGFVNIMIRDFWNISDGKPTFKAKKLKLSPGKSGRSLKLQVLFKNVISAQNHSSIRIGNTVLILNFI